MHFSLIASIILRWLQFFGKNVYTTGFKVYHQIICLFCDTLVGSLAVQQVVKNDSPLLIHVVNVFAPTQFPSKYKSVCHQYKQTCVYHLQIFHLNFPTYFPCSVELTFRFSVSPETKTVTTFATIKFL